ncbi:MAG TPA: ATP-binding SpoIIE family protein phosphatase [Caulobacteraceae bacterium]|jgi:anti-sigma regulatory factor (Ser/Thr protein kinase)|nr:ATP-binding SpoIIE family protein phosphatase [Caulobacteraceae bacterium]
MSAIAIREQTDVSEARRSAVTLARRADLDEVQSGKVALAVTELATNVLRHGGGGEMVVELSSIALEVFALDRGPGMANVAACLADGYSTAGSRGEGLGAVARQADHFDIYSRPGQGVVAVARFAVDGQGNDARWAGINVPYPGEAVSGDAWDARVDGEATSLILADGLGHGLLAHEAAAAAIETFRRKGEAPPARFLEIAHQAMRHTRGAATSVVRLTGSGVSYAGVGNVSGTLLAAGAIKKMISHNGSLGHVARHFQSFEYPADAPYLVILHSDGLGSNWSLDAYPGLSAADPALIAGILYRDFRRGRDDVTVVAARPAP